MSSGEGVESEYEYIVVGSGAGGGVVAARLAEAGCKVLVLEAGGDPLELPAEGPSERAPVDDYAVPAFHAFASENPAMRWDFFVHHYKTIEKRRQDPKYVEAYRGQAVDGVLYPRAGTLGGCTAHNAMIIVYPHNEDWDAIARSTGDASWSSENMRQHFESLENCRHRPAHYRWLSKLGFNPTRHGWEGWLHTEKAIPRTAMKRCPLTKAILDSGHVAFDEVREPVKRVKWFFQGRADPNDWRLSEDDAVGLRYVPLSTRGHARMGTRERLREVESSHPDNLTIKLGALVTRVLLDSNQRAVGVEYLEGNRLYRAHHAPSADPGVPREVRASREVILAGGAFNTPQLLMLSGIGGDDLADFGIDVRVRLPGVGRNLQDRYEVGVVNRMRFANWDVLQGAEYRRGDPQYRNWQKGRDVYTTNGGLLAVIKRSSRERKLPDLFCLGLLTNFPGYFPGYSKLITQSRNYLTWAILKAHTNNTAGTVTLRSADPRDRPEINFNYFEDGSKGGEEDLLSVVDGVQFVRKMTAAMGDEIEEEELPGPGCQSRDELADFVRAHAWGHHASCTCPIGDRDQQGVLNSRFQVHGTHGLRVVDASVFPRIPGFFPVSSIFMIGEKAAQVILAERPD